MNEVDKGTDKNERGDGAQKNEGAEKDGEGKEEGEATVIGSLRFRVPKYNPDVAVGELHCNTQMLHVRFSFTSTPVLKLQYY